MKRKLKGYVILMQNGEILSFSDGALVLYGTMEEACKDITIGEVVTPISSLPIDKKKQVEQFINEYFYNEFT